MSTGSKKRVRTGPVAGDLNLYDVANAYVSTSLASDGARLGKLWLVYDFEFSKPAVGGTRAAIQHSVSMFTLLSGSQFSLSTQSVETTVPMGYPIYNPLAITVDSASHSTFTPPAGTYRIDFKLNAGSTGNCSLIQAGIAVDNVLVDYAYSGQGSAVANFKAGLMSTAVVILNGTNTVQCWAYANFTTGQIDLSQTNTAVNPDLTPCKVIFTLLE